MCKACTLGWGLTLLLEDRTRDQFRPLGWRWGRSALGALSYSFLLGNIFGEAIHETADLLVNRLFWVLCQHSLSVLYIKIRVREGSEQRDMVIAINLVWEIIDMVLLKSQSRSVTSANPNWKVNGISWNMLASILSSSKTRKFSKSDRASKRSPETPERLQKYMF